MKSQLNLDVALDDAREAIEKSYDQYPYESNPFPLSHPGHLYVLGSLFGMTPTDPTKCRVLELGCASGGNLIPMAAQLSGSQFFGVDLSAKQVDVGKDMIKALKLKNIKLEHKDIMAVSGRIRKFDYIVCHGVYSWVPQAVQEKILEVCSKYLTENGIVYISYNTYPGWHMRESIRNMMHYHASQFDELQDKVDQSRALLNFLAQSNTQGDVFSQYLKNEAQALASAGDYYVAHEHLEGNNTPVYFNEFIRSAGEHGLQYLSETEIGTMLASNFPEQVAETLQRVGGDIIQMEQYMDFLRNRMFRATLLCNKKIELTRNIEASSIQKFNLSSPVQAVAGDVQTDSHMEFVSQSGVRIGSHQPLIKAAIKKLGETWPADIAFKNLNQHSAETVNGDSKKTATQLAADLMQAYTAGAIQINQLAADVCVDVSDKPKASDLCRLQAEKSNVVTNQRHQRVVLNEPLRQLVLLLDGKRGHDKLQQGLVSMIEKGQLQISSEGRPVADEQLIKGYAEQFLPRMLNELLGSALLVA